MQNGFTQVLPQQPTGNSCQEAIWECTGLIFNAKDSSCHIYNWAWRGKLAWGAIGIFICTFNGIEEIALLYIYIYIYTHTHTLIDIYIYIYIYISNIQSASKDSGCGLFMFRIYEEYHINLCECLMYGYCYISLSFQVYITKLTYRAYIVQFNQVWVSF